MLHAWLQDAHVRVFPFGNEPGHRRLSLDAARNERVSVQAVIVSSPGIDRPTRVACSVRTPAGIASRIRRVGYVPMAHVNTGVPEAEQDGRGHIPGFVPDPLFDESEAMVPAGEAVSFWIDFTVPRDLRPGLRRVSVELREVESKRRHPLAVDLHVHPVVIDRRRNFPVTHWFYCDALLDWYHLKPFEPRFWSILEAYIRDVVDHGQDTLYVPVFTPPLDGVKSPSQLLKIRKLGDGKVALDWSDVKRYVDLARRCGVRHFEWTHLFTQWGVKHALRIYEGQGIGEKLLWPADTAADSRTYRRFLAVFLPQLEQFLRREKLMNRSFFHISDEPHGEEHLANYRRARTIVQELAPWMKTMDALSEIVYGREGVTDMPIPIISTMKQFVDEGIPCWTYFCCGPRGEYLNRFMDTPLAKVRMSGWLFYRFKARGFLHWGYNYWCRSQTRTLIDPFTEQAGGIWPGWSYGDTFMVYPGAAGPIDSIRWEIFAQSLQDYALLQTQGVHPDGQLLAPLKDFDAFPKDLAWWKRARRRVLTRQRAARPR